MGSISRAGYQFDSTVGIKVDGAADAAGVPRNVLLAFVLGESGGDPLIIGDGGHSGGLLQLYDEGQGRGMTIRERQDADRNLAVGVPPIAAAWARNGGLQGRERVLRTAAESGHPGDPDSFIRGSRGYLDAVAGINRIADLWQRLENEAPTVHAGSQVPVLGMATEQLSSRLDAGIAYVKAHPWEAVAAAAAAALALS